MSTQQTGAEGEEQAAQFLQAHGYRIIARNSAQRGGEIDIVATVQQTLVFVEVKQRASNAFGGPLAAVTQTKQQRIARAAAQFVKAHPQLKYAQIRFDVICMLPGETQHLENAFCPARTTL